MKKHLRISLLAVLSVLAQTAYSQNTLHFDGFDDKIDCGNDTSIQISGTKLSLEAWIYPMGWMKNVYEGNVINKEYNTSNYGFMLRVGEGGKMNFAIGNGSWQELTSASPVLSLNVWQHIAGTYDGNKMRIYVNGVAVDSLAVTISISNASTTPLILGGHTTYVRYFQGMMDEVKVWNICRTGAEIAAGMNREICSRSNSLRAYYKFNQGKAAQTNTNVKKLNDLSGFKNHGTLGGFTLSGTASNWLKGQDYIKDAVNVYDTVEACVRYTSPSKRFVWFKSGVYYDTLTTVVMGCDSAIQVNLTIKKASSNVLHIHSCGPYTSPSGLYTWTKAGVYTDYLKNYLKCDSVLTINLKIGGSRDSIYPKVCNSFLSPGGKVYNISGYYIDTLKDYKTCDSIIDIFLKVNKDAAVSVDRFLCSPYPRPGGKGGFYSISGVYLDTIPTISGCDSFITTNYKNLSSASVINADVCDKYISPKGFTYNTSGNYQEVMPNKKGCDSVITINLLVRRHTYRSINVSSCRSYFNPGTGRTYTVSGIYYDTMQNFAGCDSVLITNLSIKNVFVGVTQDAGTLTAGIPNRIYQWLDCKNNMAVIPNADERVFVAVKNGEYAVEITDNDCKDTSDCYVVSGLSINSIKKQINIDIAPNPNRGQFEIKLAYTLNDATVRILDISGKVVFEKTYSELIKENIQTELQSGLYFIELRSADAYAVRRILIE